MRRMAIRFIGAVCAAILAVPVAAKAGPANLVVNGGFETGTISPSWTGTGAIAYKYDEGPHTGTYAAMFGSSGHLGTISQTLATVAGQAYTFSFWIASDGLVKNQFQAIFDGVTLYNVVNEPAFGYTLESYSVVASTASTVISFSGRDDNGFLALDDVSVTVPEPATLALLGGGLLALGVLRRRR